MKIFVLAIASLAIAAAASAQSASPTPPATPPASEAAPSLVEEVVLYPTHAMYPPELVKAGVQGTTTVAARLTPDGTTEHVSVKETSRSEKLDEIAVSIVKQLKYKLKENASGASPAILVPVEFRKDTFSELHKKTCEDLNTDLAYFTTAFPERGPGELGLFDLATGVMFFSLKPSDDKIAFAKSIKGRVANTIATCAAQPELKFFQVITQASAIAPTSK
ncbi:energy transducer TonB [Massilia glaciei]|uniref:TonB family protein n=1 Tax=Massilia glaciei TaxID=1524097 RepID=A0A2U2HLN5_9BURK|nr:energy transducer TonB [Massilia glaciei]PWF48420.1 TonB family protein [Massilia glaciei]